MLNEGLKRERRMVDVLNAESFATENRNVIAFSPHC